MAGFSAHPRLYAFALALVGRRSGVRRVTAEAVGVTAEAVGDAGARPAPDDARTEALRRVWRANHVMGGCVVTFDRAGDGACWRGGLARKAKRGAAAIPASESVFFRAASIAKWVGAMGVLRLCEEGALSLDADVSDLMGFRVRSPRFPDTPITLAHLLSHTSGMIDSRAYFRAANLSETPTLEALLREPDAFGDSASGTAFRYCNLGAGVVGCAVERATGLPFAQAMRRALFDPLGLSDLREAAAATFDLAEVPPARCASIYETIPTPGASGFDAPARIAAARPQTAPDPQRHYLIPPGGLYVTALGLARLGRLFLDEGAVGGGVEGAIDGATNGGAEGVTEGRLEGATEGATKGALSGGRLFSAEGAARMRTPVSAYPDSASRLFHGLGALIVDDPRVYGGRLVGHQGFAYGAVNGVFVDFARGRGFVSLNSGAGEKRIGRLGVLNAELARWFAQEGT